MVNVCKEVGHTNQTSGSCSSLLFSFCICTTPLLYLHKQESCTVTKVSPQVTSTTRLCIVWSLWNLTFVEENVLTGTFTTTTAKLFLAHVLHNAVQYTVSFQRFNSIPGYFGTLLWCCISRSNVRVKCFQVNNFLIKALVLKFIFSLCVQYYLCVRLCVVYYGVWPCGAVFFEAILFCAD